VQGGPVEPAFLGAHDQCRDGDDARAGADDELVLAESAA
jgi:hypothetical protein